LQHYIAQFIKKINAHKKENMHFLPAFTMFPVSGPTQLEPLWL